MSYLYALYRSVVNSDFLRDHHFSQKKLCNTETFEKCSILFKFKAGKNFNHPDEIGTGIHTLSILRIKI
jgi:hypothetical protein